MNVKFGRVGQTLDNYRGGPCSDSLFSGRGDELAAKLRERPGIALVEKFFRGVPGRTAASAALRCPECRETFCAEDRVHRASHILQL